MVQWESSLGSFVQKKRLIRAFSTTDWDTGSQVLSAPRTGTQVALQDHGQRHSWSVGGFRTTDRDTGRGSIDSGPQTETQISGFFHNNGESQVGGFFQHHGQRQRWRAVFFSTMDRDILRQEIASVLAEADKCSHKKRQQYAETFEQDTMKLLWAAHCLFYRHLDLTFTVEEPFQNSEADLPFSHHPHLPLLGQNVLLQQHFVWI